MIVPEHWAEARRQEQLDGKPVSMRRFGWSSSSMAEAQAMAEARAGEAMARLRAGERLPRRERKLPYNGSVNVPRREAVLPRHGRSRESQP